MIKTLEVKDSEKFLSMLKQLDNETKNMMYEPGERRTTLEEIESKINHIYDSNSLTLIAQENENIVGFLSAERGFAKRINHSVYIVIGILKNYRGNKIGRKLFEELEKWAAENSINRLELTVMTHNVAAIRLYKKIGFKIEGLRKNL